MDLSTPSHVKTCDLCKQSDFEVISQLDRHGKPLETDLCLTCGLVSHHQVPTEEELVKFYATEYRVAYHQERTPSARRVMRAWKNGKRIAEQIDPFLDKDGKVLEIGAGIGCTVRALSELGYEAQGIEPNHGFQEYASQSLGAHVERAVLDDLQTPESYQSILLVHVIEHFRSPATALQQIHGLLKSNGLLYVECPNLAAPFATWDRLFHFAHIHNFTPETLRRMAERCGFEVVNDFGSSDDPNLQMLLKKIDEPRCLVFPVDSASQTLRMARRYGRIGYHLRPNYIRRRVLQLTDYAVEHLVAKQATAKLLESNPQTLKAVA